MSFTDPWSRKALVLIELSAASLCQMNPTPNGFAVGRTFNLIVLAYNSPAVPDDLHPSHEQLIKRLRTVQNTRAFQNVDIISITGAFTDDQLEKYVVDKERDAAPIRKPFTTGK
jgi:hypothetical protein